MAIVKGKTRRVDVPHEKDEWFEVKRLSWRQLELAADVHSDKALKTMKDMGADMAKAMQNETRTPTKERSPEQLYDRGIVLEAGILGWSYDEEVNKENIESLDEETAAWAFGEIVGLNKATEEERKNASPRFTDPSVETEERRSNGSSPEYAKSLDASQA